VQELVRRERIVVDHPAVVEVVLDRREVGVVVVLRRVVPVEQVQQEVEADDVRGGDPVALAGTFAPLRLRLLGVIADRIDRIRVDRIRVDRIPVDGVSPGARSGGARGQEGEKENRCGGRPALRQARHRRHHFGF
jgi:hypothetical protein